MNVKRDCWLEFRRNGFWFPEGLIDILTFSLNLVGMVGGDGTCFSLYLHNKGQYGQRTTLSDSAHRIGLATILKDILTVDEGVCGWRLKNHEMRHTFRYIFTNKACTSKPTMLSDSLDRICPSTK